jgi:hypothetical protein
MNCDERLGASRFAVFFGARWLYITATRSGTGLGFLLSQVVCDGSSSPGGSTRLTETHLPTQRKRVVWGPGGNKSPNPSPDLSS